MRPALPQASAPASPTRRPSATPPRMCCTASRPPRSALRCRGTVWRAYRRRAFAGGLPAWRRAGAACDRHLLCSRCAVLRCKGSRRYACVSSKLPLLTCLSPGGFFTAGGGPGCGVGPAAGHGARPAVPAPLPAAALPAARHLPVQVHHRECLGCRKKLRKKLAQGQL